VARRIEHLAKPLPCRLAGDAKLPADSLPRHVALAQRIDVAIEKIACGVGDGRRSPEKVEQWLVAVLVPVLFFTGTDSPPRHWLQTATHLTIRPRKPL
jgi:hypothetical protein